MKKKKFVKKIKKLATKKNYKLINVVLQESNTSEYLTLAFKKQKD